MKPQARNRLVMTKAPISARRMPSDPACYSWVWVLPLPAGGFRIAAIKVPKHLVDEDICFSEDDFETPSVKIVAAISDIDTAVQEAGANPDNLDAPWHNNFPL